MSWTGPEKVWKIVVTIYATTVLLRKKFCELFTAGESSPPRRTCEAF